jgi:hypothetical protein
MSLQGFHVFFIMVAALFCVSMAAWAFYGSSEELMGSGARPFGFGSLIAGLGLLSYGLWFALKKSKTLAA